MKLERKTQAPGTPAAQWRISAQGDRSLLIVFGNQPDVALGRQCIAAAAAIRLAAFEGVTDIVPTFTTVAVHYQPQLFGSGSSFTPLSREIEKTLLDVFSRPLEPSVAEHIDIPVCYGGEFGPDLSTAARHCGVDAAELVRLHTTAVVYVFMLGFAPGAPYIGLHDAQLDIARRTTPRTAVPAGSVAIANRQTVIYPNVSPGGWHIIGATPLVLFDPERSPAALLAPGNTVRFFPISPDRFRAMRQRGDA